MSTDPGPEPALIACSHGTDAAEGRRAMARLREEIAALRPGLEVVQAYVDVQRPHVADVVRDLATRGRRCVVVPLLLSAGYHVRVDIADAVAAGSGAAVAASPLGPNPVLVDVLAERLAASGTGPADPVLLAAAGSGDPRATADVERTSAELGRRRGRPVIACYLTAAEPTVTAAVAGAVAADPAGTVTVATYLLCPGVFADRLADLAIAAGAGRVTPALAGHPALARLALHRYDAARGRTTGPQPLPDPRSPR